MLWKRTPPVDSHFVFHYYYLMENLHGSVPLVALIRIVLSVCCWSAPESYGEGETRVLGEKGGGQGGEMQVARALMRPVVAAHNYSSVRLSGGLAEFFEAGRDPKSDKKIVYGRSWKASELRLKSWDDLHKLWYVLLKEKNMLLSQKQMLSSQSLRMPNPERHSKVRKSMCRLKQVLTERALEIDDLQKRNVLKRMINGM